MPWGANFDAMSDAEVFSWQTSQSSKNRGLSEPVRWSRPCAKGQGIDWTTSGDTSEPSFSLQFGVEGICQYWRSSGCRCLVSSDAEEPGGCEWPDLREVAEMRRQGGCGGGGGRLAATGGGQWLPGVGAAAGVAGRGLRPGTGWTQGPGVAATTGRNGWSTWKPWKPWKPWKNRGGGGCQFDGLGAPGRFEESCAEHLTIEDEVWENSVDCHVGCLCQEQLGHTMSHPSCLSCTERLLWTFSIESQTGTQFISIYSVD